LAIEGATLLPMMNLLRYPLAVLLAIRAAAVAARDNYETAKQTLRGLRVTLDNLRIEARLFAMLVRDILKPILGTEYSSAWDVVGFVGGLEASRNVDELITLLETIVSFLTANPALGAARNLTAADVQAVLTSLKAARQAVTDQELTVGTLQAVRDQKFDAIRKALRGLKDELTDQLDPLDLRWKAFGFNLPGADATPDVPENLSVILIGPNAAAMKWGASARAGYYRVWRRVIGVDAEPVAVGSPADLDFTLENLPAASTVEIYISAVNNGGESQLSEKVTLVTH
ncbi:MAG: hypothetical protein JWM68_2256, partial [Verrucomicrobiales bacterium]|nr:hypothetical protein [Verrucomicrobiales bacterium]